MIFMCDVSPRDGLQNEARTLSADQKVALIEGLRDSGLPRIEATSFVSPKAIPQLADAEEVMARVSRTSDCELVVLVPNKRGAERALACKPDELNLVMSVSESHNRANLKMTPNESFNALRDVIAFTAGKAKVNVSLSCSFGCPFEGDVSEEAVLTWVSRYAALGVTGVSLCDTTGMAYPSLVRSLTTRVLSQHPNLRVTLHFHNSRGLGLSNVLEGIRAGVTHFDACTGGIGGCPYAPGASGNVCMEDIVHALQCEGLETGINLEKLLLVAKGLPRLLGHGVWGQVAYAGPRKRLFDPTQAKQQ